MKKYLHPNIANFVRLCREYQRAGLGTSQMKKKSHIPFDLLIKGNCLSVPPHVTWSGDALDIENSLKEYYVLEVDTERQYVEIAGLEENEDSNTDEQTECVDDGYFYIWCIFHYTYRLVELDYSQWMEFIWVSILLPYLYLLNKFGTVSLEVLQQMLLDYSVTNHEISVEDTLKRLSGLNYQGQKADYDRKMCTIINRVSGISQLLPNKGQVDAAIDAAKAGLSVAISIAKETGG